MVGGQNCVIELIGRWISGRKGRGAGVRFNYLSIPVVKTKSNLQGQLLQRTLADHGSSLREVRARTRNRGRRGMLLGSLALRYLLSWHSSIQTPCLAMLQPTVGWALLYQLMIRTIPHRHAHRPL